MAELVIVHGPPGSGKTTQCERLATDPPPGKAIVHVSAGRRLREIRTGSAQSAFSAIINDPHAQSPLPDYIVNGAIFECVPSESPDVTGIIDGYPRHPSAIEIFTKGSRQAGHQILGCISLELTMGTSITRLLSRGMREGERIYGGSESYTDFAAQRYREHQEVTQQTILALGEIMPVVTVNAEPDPDTVFSSFYQAFGRLAIRTP